MNTIDTQRHRTRYGKLYASSAAEGTAVVAAAIRDARALAKLAAGKLPAEYDDMAWGRGGRERGKKIGRARYHEVYDVNAAGTRALVCVREVEGARYGQKTISKQYYVVSKRGTGASVIEANKSVAAKAAKAAKNLGGAIDVVLGRAKLKIRVNEKRTGYKCARRDDDGRLVSVEAAIAKK